MGRCNVLGCPMKRYKKHSNISLHKLPKCKKTRDKWLDILGAENVVTTKYTYICSLHFEEKCFNRTLDVIRLRDDALPSRELLIPAQFDDCDKKQSVTLKEEFEEKATCSTFNYAESPAQFDNGEKQDSVPHKVFEEKVVWLVCGTTDNTTNTEEDKTPLVIQKLKSKCKEQTIKIKRLNEKVKRQSKRIADLKTLIKDLKKNRNDEYASVLEQCAGQALNIFLKDPIHGRANPRTCRQQ
ncbi:hypothetical protein JYU34_006677 [Plutella xylostella]|uniref:THAP-type domain-containing protein n=1 Tax=Plutella xylostella TaxID=51655 RepID=A0ABQ7QSM8_PLUXY|nr:hypothetical protein JYU34_006677 [Plutella xylostella]